MSTLHLNQPVRIDSGITVGVARARVSVEDLTAEAASQVLTFNDIALGRGESRVPANARIMFAWINVIEPFEGGDAESCAVKVGDADDDDELITSVSVFTGASGLLPKSGAYALGTFEAAYAPIITLTVTGDGVEVADLTAGAIEVCVQYAAISTDSVTS